MVGVGLDWDTVKAPRWKRLPQAIALLAGLIVCLPSMAWAQVTNTLETDNAGDGDVTGQGDGNATLLQPPNTPRVRGSAVQAPPPVNVTTYHFDNRRNGWNNAEAVLNPVNVAGAQFNLLHSVPLDEQVDGQPLVLNNVVYVATENNTIYAIDGTSGAVLQRRNFGTPVPQGSLPGQCNNNSSNVGINSTPVIDPATGIMYVMVYTLESGGPVFRLHAVNPGSLADVMTPRVVTASHKLSDNSTYSFKAGVSRQRAALLAVNGNIYAGFASFCDHSADQSRGWILGWNAGTLQPLSSNDLRNLEATSVNSFLLTAVWMSGYGLAAAGPGNILFVTGNSDYSGTAYDPSLNLSESVVKAALDLTGTKDHFTPSDVATLERNDTDLGSGGVMALPTQPGSIPNLLLAGGKDGRSFLLNRLSMGQPVGTFQTGPCWCGPSYFGASDGVGRVVTSGGNHIRIWKLQTSQSTTMTLENISQDLPSTLQDQGSFTTISSNGTQAGTAVIWTVRRPVDFNTKQVMLWAFDASSGKTLTSRAAGTWPQLGGNANIVPVAVNGKVYVASFKQLAIFGIGPAGATTIAPLATAAAVRPLVTEHRVSGTIVSLNGDTVTIRTRSGQALNVLTTEAIRIHQAVPPFVGENIEAEGKYDAFGVLQATNILRAKEPAAWEPDQ